MYRVLSVASNWISIAQPVVFALRKTLGQEAPSWLNVLSSAIRRPLKPWALEVQIATQLSVVASGDEMHKKPPVSEHFSGTEMKK
jgi:hypothetical protein